MSKHTSPEQREAFFRQHQAGSTYRQIADQHGVSTECVRYWCRHQRDGGSTLTVYDRQPQGILSRFDPRVRYVILRLRLEHPRWGPERIHHHLTKRLSLHGLSLPSPASIGRYLHQWHRFRRRPKSRTPPKQRLKQPQVAHQRWQLDFKEKIPVADSRIVHLHTACDPVGATCIGVHVFAIAQSRQRPRIRLEDVQTFLRLCFARWKTLPQEIQTDGETVLTGKPCDEAFPSRFTLWLKGLGIEHLVIRPGKPTDNAEVERWHRTINDYAIVRRHQVTVAELQAILNNALDELVFELPSRAKDCRGRPPAVAHPELFEPQYPFRPEHELARFDLRRVDQFLATFAWSRLVGSDGRVRMGTERYYVGTAHARRHIVVRFDPTDRHFVFYGSKDPDDEIRRLPAKALDIADLTGLAEWPIGLGLQQLPLPLCFANG